MALPPANALSPRTAEPAVPGSWKLVAGRAITLEPREAGRIEVAQGQLWATYDGPHGGRLDQSGDLVLGVGERLSLHAGQRLVIEAWNHGDPAYFTWETAPAAQPATAALVQPLADLRRAIALGGDAAGRLAAGVAVLAWHWVTGARQPVAQPACCGEGVAG
jgi:hypothetical protein